MRGMAWALGLVPLARDRCAITLPGAPSPLRSVEQVLIPVRLRGEVSRMRGMAWALRFEPRTVGLENRCSIQLSYAHIIEPER